MVQFKEEINEVEIVSKSGVRTLMPSVGVAKDYAEGIWKGEVDKIEVKTVIQVKDK